MARPKKDQKAEPKPKVVHSFELDDSLDELAKEVMEAEKLDLHPAKLKLIKEYPYISKKTIGKCIKASKELKFFGQFDYLIKFSGDVWDMLDDKTRYILMYHELLHAYPKQNDKTGEVDYKIMDHNVKDFNKIISKFGIDWFNNLKTITESVS